MKYYTDWSCRLLPMMRDLVASAKDAKQALEALHALGLNRFCMTPDFDASVDSVPMFLLRREKSMQELKQILTDNIRINAAACVNITQGLHQTPRLAKLCLPGTNYLPVRLPLTPQPEWLAREINQLLYHCGVKLLFMNFDLYPIFYSSQSLEKLLHLPHAAYQFNYRALADPQMREYLKLLINKNTPILFGTSVNSVGKACYYELDYYRQLAHMHFTDYECDVLFFQKKIYRK